MSRVRVALLLACAAVLAPRLSAESRAPAGGPRPRVALVLSGGSALGIAHVGVIRELERAGIPIDMVMGTSMGALVGGLYAAGYSPDRMEALVTGLDWSRYFAERRGAPADRYFEAKRQRYLLRLGFDGRKALTNSGLIKGQNLMTLFSALTLHVLPVRNFDDLPVPYRAVAADILTGEKVVFSSGSIAEAMRASMSIPGLFSPYEAGGHSLVDGGIADNMPVDLARQMGADIVIAVECRQRPATDASSLDSAFKVTGQALNLFIEENMGPSRKGADLLIRPDLASYNRLSFADARALIDAGQAGALAREADIRALAERIAATRPLVEPGSEPNRAAMGDPPVLDRLEIEAPSPPEEEAARKAFGGLVARRLDRAEIADALDGAYAAGGYSLVKLDLLPDPDGEGAIGVISMTAAEPRRNEFLLGGNYRGLVSTHRSSDASVLSALYFGDVFGKDSAFFVETGIGSLTRAYAEYFQPLGPFFAKPFLRYQSQYDFYSLGRGLVLRADYRSAGGGMGLGCGLGKDAELELGWAYDSVLGLAEDISSDSWVALPSERRDDAAFLFFEASFDNRSALAFPERGLEADLGLRWADRAFGGEDAFVAAELRWNAALPLSRRLSLGFAGCAATDFTGLLPGAPSLPPTRPFDLRSSGMFYGLDPRPDLQASHHMLGLGLELRRKLGRISSLVGGDIFGLANLSIAAAYANAALGDEPIPPRWNPSLGLGLRLTSDFGMLLAGGCVVDSGDSDSLRPALSLHVGTFRDFPEDRR
jgi:NTE family protein